MTDVTLGASGNWLGIPTGVDGTALLAKAILVADYGFMESRYH